MKAVRKKGAYEPRRLQVALVGCGWFVVRAHLPALQKLESISSKALGFRIRLYALCSRSQTNVDRACKKLDQDKRQEVKTFVDLDAVLADPLVDVVDLVLPIPLMPAAIEKCLAAGKQVLSEKPVALSPEIAGRLWTCYTNSGPESTAGCYWCVFKNWEAKPTVMPIHHLRQTFSIGTVQGYACKLSLEVPLPSEQGFEAQLGSGERAQADTEADNSVGTEGMCNFEGLL